MYGFISGVSILCLWSMCLFLCQCHIVLISMALQCSLKSVNVMPPANAGLLQSFQWRLRSLGLSLGPWAVVHPAGFLGRRDFPWIAPELAWSQIIGLLQDLQSY